MVTVIIPAYNEAARIGATVQAVRAIIGVDEIIVIDDGSTDDTGRLAEEAGADVVLRQKNSGKGAALQTGYEVSIGDILLLLDADLAESAVEGQRLLAPVLCGQADMSIANFAHKGGRGGGMGLVVRLARWGIYRLGGQRMATPLSGQRAVRRDLIACAGGFAAGWQAEVALTIAALRLHYRVVEVDTEMHHRVTGRSPTAIGHRCAQFVAVARVLFDLWLHSRSSDIHRPATHAERGGSGRDEAGATRHGADDKKGNHRHG